MMYPSLPVPQDKKEERKEECQAGVPHLYRKDKKEKEEEHEK